ncbi:unnamed protein product [Knipowitschia caucasica]
MMAKETCLALVFLFMSLQWVRSSTVDPPEKVTVTDPGHLGSLHIHWGPRLHRARCSVLYEVHYYDSSSSKWTSIRTSLNSVTAQFDLAQEVKVRVYTVFSGECVEGGITRSQNYTEVVQKPDRRGIDCFQAVTCVYFNMEHLVCHWKKNAEIPGKAQEKLYYWHRQLGHAKECPRYITSGGERTGCIFSGIDIPTFTDLNLCVNASSEQPIRALYSTLQIQNHVKPDAPTQVSVDTAAERQLKAHWNSPSGRIPHHCLLWQLQTSRNGRNTFSLIPSSDATVMLPLPDFENICLKVRSKLNKYCADSGVWSDWSPSVCYRARGREKGDVFLLV